MRNTIVKQLREGKVKLPGKDGKEVELPLKDLGIGYPVIVSDNIAMVPQQVMDPNAPEPKGNEQPKVLNLKRFDFTVQFAWSPTPPGKRAEMEQERAKAQPGALAADGAAAGTGGGQ